MQLEFRSRRATADLNLNWEEQHRIIPASWEKAAHRNTTLFASIHNKITGIYNSSMYSCTGAYFSCLNNIFLPQEVKTVFMDALYFFLQYLFQWKISYHVCPRRFFCKISNKIVYYPMFSGKEMFCWERFVFLGESETKQFTHCLCWLKIFIYWNYVIVNPEKVAEFLFSWSC